MTTILDTDTTTLESLDFAPPCEYTYGNKPCGNVAEWAIWTKAICCRPAMMRFHCNKCYEFRSRSDNKVCCNFKCGKVLDVTHRDIIVRVERI